MKITITIETGNDAIPDNDDEALAYVLNTLARTIKRRGIENVGRVMDYNGNTIGRVDTEL